MYKRIWYSMIAIGAGLLIPATLAHADGPDLKDLTAQWWQWALSIPPAVNPMLDSTGVNCMVGQRDSVWFLAGGFFGGTAVRNCSVPQGMALFFPVINSIGINTPNVCGQIGSLSVSDMRAANAGFINTAVNMSVQLDGRAVANLRRVQSFVFPVALPEDNVFDAPCSGAGLGNVPAGIFSPAVDEGFYVLLDPLAAGTHTLHFHAEAAGGFSTDATYTLNVVPVSVK
jgi:hypothetical protein